MSKVLLYSGGLDSFIAWHFIGKPDALYADLGHRYAKKELSAIKKTIPATTVVSIPWVGKFEREDAYIPARNLLLATLPVIAGYDEVCIVSQKDEMELPDRSPVFFEKASSLLGWLQEREVVVFTPFADVDKTDMVTWYMENVGDLEALLSTVGCYSSEKGHCGKCQSCFRRWVALMNNDIQPGYEVSRSIKAYYKARLGDYSLDRQQRMKKWL